MKKITTTYPNLLLFTGLFAFTFLWAMYLNKSGHTGGEHFLSSFTRSLIGTTISYYFIRISLEQQNNLPSELFNAKRKRIALFTSLFTWIQITTLTVFDAYLYNTEIKWFKSIATGLGFAIIFFLIISAFSKYLPTNRLKDRLRKQ